MPKEDAAPKDNFAEIEKVLSHERQMDLKISRDLDDLIEPYTVFVLTEPKDFAAIKTGIVRRIAKQKRQGIYIAFNTGFSKIESNFEKEKISIDNIHFIDMISRTAGGKIVEKKNVSYIDGPSDLTELIILMEKKLNTLEGKGAVMIVDSVSTMLVYNESSTIEKFIHALLEKVNSFDSSGILLSSDYGEHEAITTTISQFVDKVIKI